MHRRLLYEDASGQLRILVPYERFQQPNESEEEALQRLAFGFLPPVSEFIVCRPQDIPNDLTWRKAWRKGDVNDPIKIDFQECIRIHRERLNVAASRKIAQLNLELELALEIDNLPTQVAIRRTKHILRTVHLMDLSHCKTPEDIKFSIPKELYEFWDFYSLNKEKSNDPVPSKSESVHFIGPKPDVPL